MFLHSIRSSLLAMASALILVACGGGGGSSSAPPPPAGGITLTNGDGQVTLSWQSTPGVDYWIFAAPNNPNLNLSNWLATTGSTYRLNVTSPFVVTGLSNGTPYSFFITGRVNGEGGGEATPTVTATPRLAGAEWLSGASLNTGTKTGMTYGSYADTATNTVQYRYVAVGNGGRMLRASKIDTWTPITPLISSNLNAATFGFAKFIAVGDAGKIIYSTDTQTWTQATSNSAQNFNAVVANGSLAVAVGNNGTIMTSKDAITWTAATTVPSSAHLYGLTYTVSGSWMAVGAGGTLLTSTDGTTWTAQATGTTADLKAVGALASTVNSTTTYTYVVAGQNGTILKSNDLLAWTAQNSNTMANFNDMSSLGQFLLVGSGGTVLTSLDGATWTRQTTNVSSELTSILKAENQYLTVNANGEILYSK
ncbi:MAG: Ycf48-like protein [Pseudomonadota bacterium]